MGVWVWFALGCAEKTADTGSEASTTDEAQVVTSYQVALSTDPAPLQAGAEGRFTAAIQDQDGRPIPDLQQSHERMLHVIFVSEDLEHFLHTHQEDYTPISAEDLQASTFSLPLTLPVAGTWGVALDFAHRNQYLSDLQAISVEGSPAASPVQDLTVEAEETVEGVHAALEWIVAPQVGREASWQLTLTDATTGEDITDGVQYLGADAHCALFAADLSWAGHTHAWVPGMENVPPGHDMPVTYPGPLLPFKYVFPKEGMYKMWVQFSRASAPDAPLAFPFVFEVLP